MIGYPGSQLALQQSGGDRQRARDLMRRSILAEAERQAELAGLSSNCRYGNHATTGGCSNDGSTCICACHD